MTKQPVAGSERKPLKGAMAVGAADPNETFQVTVVVRPRSFADFKRRVNAAIAAGAPNHVQREEFAQRFGADPTDCSAIRKFADQFGLTVAEENLGRRTIRLSGTVAQFQSAFNVNLHVFQYQGKVYRCRTGAVYVPDELREIVEAVLGLDNRPQSRTHFRVRPPAESIVARAVPSQSFSPVQVASLYGFPSKNATGQCIGLIELGGGFENADIQAFFAGLKVPVPSITAVSVDGASNLPTGDPNGPDGEVMLDIEVAGAAAPGASIVVYFGPNTDAGFLDAITTAIHDTTNKPSVISISWGSAESTWTQQAMTAFDSAFQAAATLGVTVTVASGDNGSSDGEDSGNHVDFPASSSFALGCGGTSLRASNGKITSELVWDDLATQEGATGGGVSTIFALPTWQQGLKVTTSKGQQSPLSGRGVPDVSGDADPETGYDVRVDGSATVIGGTSAVAPLWAALVALMNSESATTVGFINPKLYGKPSACRDVTSGNNGAFEAARGWDACTGLGSPSGQAVAERFASGMAEPAD